MSMTTGRKSWALALSICGLAVMSMGAAPARAGDFSIGFEFGSHSRSDHGAIRIEKTARVWVPATYRTVCEQVWVEPVYRTECERVWVPDRYEERCETIGWGRARRERIVRVLVEPAHYEERERKVLVAQGYYKTVERQELVCEGHWEERPVYSFGGAIKGRVERDNDWRHDRKDDWRDNRRDDDRRGRDDRRDSRRH